MSEVRRDLKKIAAKHLYNLCHFPRYFEVRWTRFTYELLESVLNNWKTSTKYNIFVIVMMVKSSSSRVLPQIDRQGQAAFNMLCDRFAVYL